MAELAIDVVSDRIWNEVRADQVEFAKADLWVVIIRRGDATPDAGVGITRRRPGLIGRDQWREPGKQNGRQSAEGSSGFSCRHEVTKGKAIGEAHNYCFLTAGKASVGFMKGRIAASLASGLTHPCRALPDYPAT